VLLFEPNRADAEMFFTNMFSYSSRRRLCEHAYQKTREEILKRRHELQPMLARHGLELNLAALRDKRKTLGVAVAKARRAPLAPLSATTAQLAETLDDLARFVAHAQAQAQMTQNRPDAFANTPR
jgi:hypothetical protein